MRLAPVLAALAVAAAPARAPAAPLDVPPREVRFRLDVPDPGEMDWFVGFRDASVERPGPLRLYANGKWGSWTGEPWHELEWIASEGPPAPDDEPVDTLAFDAEPLHFDLSAPIGQPLFNHPAFAPRVHKAPFLELARPSLASDGLGSLFVLPPSKPLVDWRCRRRPVTIVRYGGESEKLELVRCDGSMAPGALDALSILARPPEVTRPVDGLPDEPDYDAWRTRREWVDGVRVVHPRLVWAVQRLADAFPGKPIYLYSGYRPLAEVNDGSGHKSMHAEGRAIDIAVMRVPNEKLFEVCRELKDVACGFYPKSKFVHVGVRRAHTGKAMWIDASQPGEPAQYVDSWPGVVEEGALSWQKAPAPTTN